MLHTTGGIWWVICPLHEGAGGGGAGGGGTLSITPCINGAPETVFSGGQWEDDL